MNNELITVDFEKETISARELYEKIGSTERFSTWFERQLQYGFTESVDYVGCKTFNALARQELQDYALSIDMAKQLCMVQKNDKAKEIRKYLIAVEKAWNTPEQVMARALKMADKTIRNLNIQIQELQPKAEYFDALVDRNLLTNLRDTAKELGVKEREFVGWLEKKHFIYRDMGNKVKPFALYITGDKKYFEIKEFTRDNGYTGTQTMITPRGREAFRLLLIG